jgi:hypothetical protein
MTPQEVYRAAFDHVEQHCDGTEKHIEVHGHPLEPEVIINVKQEPQVNRYSQKHFNLTVSFSFRLNSIFGSYCHYLKRMKEIYTIFIHVIYAFVPKLCLKFVACIKYVNTAIS